jgi:uncharacterized protein YciI
MDACQPGDYLLDAGADGSRNPRDCALEARMLYIIYQEDREEGAAGIRAANREKHLAYLDQHADILVLGGALLADDGVGRTGSCLIINVASREEAEEFSRHEPFRTAGLFKSVKIARMRRGQWNPAAAPKSAEGN